MKIAIKYMGKKYYFAPDSIIEENNLPVENTKTTYTTQSTTTIAYPGIKYITEEAWYMADLGDNYLATAYGYVITRRYFAPDYRRFISNEYNRYGSQRYITSSSSSQYNSTYTYYSFSSNDSYYTNSVTYTTTSKYMVCGTYTCLDSNSEIKTQSIQCLSSIIRTIYNVASSSKYYCYSYTTGTSSSNYYETLLSTNTRGNVNPYQRVTASNYTNNIFFITGITHTTGIEPLIYQRSPAKTQRTTVIDLGNNLSISTTYYSTSNSTRYLPSNSNVMTACRKNSSYLIRDISESMSAATNYQVATSSTVNVSDMEIDILGLMRRTESYNFSAGVTVTTTQKVTTTTE